MSTGHIIIDAFLLLVTIIAAFYIIYSVFKTFGFAFLDWYFSKDDKPEEPSELHSRARYKATEKLMEEINKNQN